ncbi:MAG: nucleoid-structuring protein H-NS [Erysipelotrichaceae bacterium]|jgi:4-hydroxy 2-oxovalerate aldolase|nr:nucleoid-structuring protein H-NS [Erysipelotrichaceae bacterium]
MNTVDSIKILDATLRDGGLVNDFYFTDDFARALYKANIEAGVDYMEFGYRADKKQFDVNKFGKWKFTTDEDILGIIGKKDPRMKISIMTDVGRTDYINDIKPKKDSPVDLVRVATYVHQIDDCIKMINHISSLGYEVTCNIMAISTATDQELIECLNKLVKTNVIGVYIVDSYGSLYPKQVRHLTKLFHDILAPAGKMVGIHTHNNQQCAFANTIEAKACGARLLDATCHGMGRGAGNCFLEGLIGYLDGKKYHLNPVLDFVRKYMIPLKESGVEWGYNTSYLLTGLTNQHPRTAIAATKDKDDNFIEQYKFLSYK